MRVVDGELLPRTGRELRQIVRHRFEPALHRFVFSALGRQVGTGKLLDLVLAELMQVVIGKRAIEARTGRIGLAQLTHRFGLISFHFVPPSPFVAAACAAREGKRNDQNRLSIEIPLVNCCLSALTWGIFKRK